MKGKPEDQMLSVMLEELRSVDKITLLKEEDNVIRSILHGKSRSKVLTELNEKHTKAKITLLDLNKFLCAYKNILQHEKTDMEKAYVRRLVKSKTGLNNELIDLATTAKDMADRYDAEGDNTNAVAAVRTAADIFMKYAKVDGLINDKPELSITMKMDELVKKIASGSNDISENMRKIIDIEASEVEEIDGKSNS